MPQADFSWRISTTIKSSESANALTTTKDIDPEDPSGGETVLEPRPVPGHPTAMDSILKLDNVRTEHYATEFRCAASNLYGGDEHVIGKHGFCTLQFEICALIRNYEQFFKPPGFRISRPTLA